MHKNNTSLKLTLTGLLAATATVFTFTACEVKKTQEGEMPEVSVEGGQVPAYDVEGPDVKVEEKKIEIPDSITVPDVDIVTPEEKRAGGNMEDGEMEATPAPAM